VRTIERLQQNLSISVPYLSQVAGEAAFEATAECEAIKAGYAANRAFLLKALPEIGLGDFLPVDGAFYIYLDIGRYSNDSMAFCRMFLKAPASRSRLGSISTKAVGSRTVRLSFAGSLAECEEAVERIGAWLKRALRPGAALVRVRHAGLCARGFRPGSRRRAGSRQR
jgi:aspartate/methionine/tyrosine aminotransferase